MGLAHYDDDHPAISAPNRSQIYSGEAQDLFFVHIMEIRGPITPLIPPSPRGFTISLPLRKEQT